MTDCTNDVPARLLRWIAVLPVVILSVLIISFPIHWVIMLIQFLGVPADNTIDQFAVAFFAPLTMVCVAYLAAPYRKFFSAISAAIVWAMLFGTVGTYSLSNGSVSLRHVICVTALGCAGATMGLLIAYKKTRPKKTNPNR